jgi:hypothetical protein
MRCDINNPERYYIGAEATEEAQASTTMDPLAFISSELPRTPLRGCSVNKRYYAARSLFEVMGSTGAAGSLGWNSATAASTVGTSW